VTKQEPQDAGNGIVWAKTAQNLHEETEKRKTTPGKKDANNVKVFARVTTKE